MAIPPAAPEGSSLNAPGITLSPAQEVILRADLLAPGIAFGPHAVATIAVNLSISIDLPRLRESLDNLPRRHDALRTATSRGVRATFQGDATPGRVELTVVELEETQSPFSRADVPPSLVAAVQQREYSPWKAPALWAFLGRFGGDPEDCGAVLVLVSHHSLVDAWSLRLLLRDLLTEYVKSGEEEAGVPMPRQYAEHTEAMLGRYTPQRIETALPFWKRTLGDLRSLPVPLGPGHENATLPVADRKTRSRFGWSPVSQQSLDAAARRQRTTSFVLLLTAFALSLRKVSGARDLTIPVFTHGRDRADWDTAGFFMNVIPTRIVLADSSPTDAVRRVHNAFYTAMAHEIPLSMLFEHVPMARALFEESGPFAAHLEVIQLPCIDLGQASGLVRKILRMPPHPSQPAGPMLPFSGMRWTWLPADLADRPEAVAYWRPDLLPSSFVSELATEYRTALRQLADESR